MAKHGLAQCSTSQLRHACTVLCAAGAAAAAAGGMVLEEEWAGHEAGVLAVLPAGSRVLTLAADGSVRAWCSALPCPEEAAAR